MAVSMQIIPARVNFDSLSRDKMVSWKGETQPSHVVPFLEQEKSWSKDIIQYGKSDETCIEFIYIDNILDEINCRLDLRRFTKTELILLVESTGGFERTIKDFDSLNPIDVKEIQTQYGTGKVGKLSDGTTVVARQGSTTGGATLEIKVSNSKVYKI